MTSNDEVFFDLEAALATRLMSSMEIQVEKVAKDIQSGLKEYLDRIFDEFADEIDEQLEQAPSYVGKGWHPLDDYYKDRKTVRGSDGFAIWNRDSFNASKALGVKMRGFFGDATMSIGVKLPDGSVVSFRYDRNNRLRYAKGSYRLDPTKKSGRAGLGGRFASGSLAKAINAQFSISFERPKISDIESQITFPWLVENISKQFAHFERGRLREKQPARPFLVPYLKWKLGEQLDATINSIIRGSKK